METKKRLVPIKGEYHAHLMDGKRLTSDLEKALNELEAEGFTILSVTPVISGNWGSSNVKGYTDVTGWSYSLTEV